MNMWTRSMLAASVIAAPFLALSTSAHAGVGDLLVAPTRIVLDGRKGGEIILNNIGDEPATYRVSVEFRRMTKDGDLVDVTTPSATDKAAEDMIVYAPRKVTLAPHEPQAIRIAARPPQGLPDGEYRVHMLFRAISACHSREPGRCREAQGGPVQTDTDLRCHDSADHPPRQPSGERWNHQCPAREERRRGAVGLDLTRTGSRSTFGEVRVMKAGFKDPIAVQKGVAVYTEVGQRHVSILVPEASRSAAAGAVTVEYLETYDDGTHLLAQTDAVLR